MTDPSAPPWVETSSQGLLIRPPVARLPSFLLTTAKLLSYIPTAVLALTISFGLLFVVIAPIDSFHFMMGRRWEQIASMWWMLTGPILHLIVSWVNSRFFPTSEIRLYEHDMVVEDRTGVHRFPLRELTSVQSTRRGWLLHRAQGAPLHCTTAATEEERAFVFDVLQQRSEAARTHPVEGPSLRTQVTAAWQEFAVLNPSWRTTEVDRVVLAPPPTALAGWWAILTVVLTVITILLSTLILLAAIGDWVVSAPHPMPILVVVLASVRVFVAIGLSEAARRWLVSPSTLHIRRHDIEIERNGRTTQVALRDLRNVSHTPTGWRCVSDSGATFDVATHEESAASSALFRWLSLVGEQARQQGTATEVPESLDALQGSLSRPASNINETR